MSQFSQHEIKKEKKKSLFLREISCILHELSSEEPDISKVYITRIDFAEDYSICYVYLVPYENLSHETYQKAFERLKLYKPSIRKELAEKLNQRHTPDIKFLFDESKEKQYKIEKLLDKIHDELTFQKK